MAKTFGSQSLKKHGKYDDDWKDWMDGLPMISFKEVSQYTLRPLTPMLMMARHWPKSLQSGKNCPPIWCPKFNSETQKFDLDLPCHLHDDFGDRWKAQKCIIFGALVREWQEEGKKNPTGLVVLPGSASIALVQIVGINKYDIADPVKGCDLSVINAKDAAPAQQWQIQRVDRTPLTEDEKKFKLPDLDKLSPDFGDAKYLKDFSAAMKRKLAAFSYYVSPKEEGGEGWEGYKKDREGQPYTDFPELVALVGDGKQGGSKDAEPKRKARSNDDEPQRGGGKLTRHHDVVDDDDAPPPSKKPRPKPPEDDEAEAAASDEGEQESESAEDTPPPAKKPATKPKPAPVDKDEEDDPPFDTDDDADAASSSDDDAAEEEAPPPKKNPKPAAKAAVEPLEGSEAWSANPAGDGSVPAMVWKIGPDGTSVPKCYGVFAGAAKCKKCPVRKACMAADAEA